jgi:hypothetical protein
MKVRLTIILIVVLVKSECLIENCEACSESSSSICINCMNGFIRDKHLGCRKIMNHTENSLKQLEVIENCKEYSEFGCKECREGYNVFNNRCSPICSEDCTCFYSYECLEIRRLQTSCVAGLYGCSKCYATGLGCSVCTAFYG